MTISVGIASSLLVFRTTTKVVDERSMNKVLSEFASIEQTYANIASFFVDLAKERGGEYAFEAMKRADFPPDVIDLHLMGHLVGDELYYQEGFDGMRVCTEDFRNACSHAIVIRAFLEHGLGVLDKVYSACSNAPGGKGAYTMCFHGLGHGVLAHTEYEFFDAVDICSRLGTSEYNYREYPECVGGIVMEMVDGVHDPGTWLEKSQAFFKKEEPLFPCSSEELPDTARGICYTYLTPYLFKVAGVNFGTLNESREELKIGFDFCNDIPRGDIGSRGACFGGFGKEFVGFVRHRDIRLKSLADMSEEQMQQIFDWCMLTDDVDGRFSCIEHALASLYWGGENPRDIAIRFCNLLGSNDYQNFCFRGLIGMVSYYMSDMGYKRAFCDDVPEAFQEQCDQRLL